MKEQPIKDLLLTSPPDVTLVLSKTTLRLFCIRLAITIITPPPPPQTPAFPPTTPTSPQRPNPRPAPRPHTNHPQSALHIPPEFPSSCHKSTHALLRELSPPNPHPQSPFANPSARPDPARPRTGGRNPPTRDPCSRGRRRRRWGPMSPAMHLIHSLAPVRSRLRQFPVRRSFPVQRPHATGPHPPKSSKIRKSERAGGGVGGKKLTFSTANTT